MRSSLHDFELVEWDDLCVGDVVLVDVFKSIWRSDRSFSFVDPMKMDVRPAGVHVLAAILEIRIGISARMPMVSMDLSTVDRARWFTVALTDGTFVTTCKSYDVLTSMVARCK